VAAIGNIQHKAQPDDVSALKKVKESTSASEAEKQLASIVLDFHHQAGAQAQEKLKRLARQSYSVFAEVAVSRLWLKAIKAPRQKT